MMLTSPPPSLPTCSHTAPHAQPYRHQTEEEWSCGDEQWLKIEHDMAGLLYWHREHWAWERDPMLGSD